jgi:hypothetical protein
LVAPTAKKVYSRGALLGEWLFAWGVINQPYSFNFIATENGQKWILAYLELVSRN